MSRLPWLLVGLRALSGPIVVMVCLLHAPPGWPLGLLVLAFVSDVFDGIVARKLGIATASLRLADSVTDAFFYLCVACGAFLAYPEVWQQYRFGVLLIVGLEGSRWVIDLVKFGRVAAYHLWSAKAWGIALFLGFGELFLRGRVSGLFAAAIAVGVITQLEGLVMSFVLPRWVPDVPSLWHALALRRAQAGG
jgi:phosphatidylglycerophosphate synthase